MKSDKSAMRMQIDSPPEILCLAALCLNKEGGFQKQHPWSESRDTEKS